VSTKCPWNSCHIALSFPVNTKDPLKIWANQIAYNLTDDYDQLSPGLVEKATAAGHWKSGNFNFKHAFSAEYDGLSITETQKPEHRQTDGEKLMTNM
jgi:hypothetical protein